jgi:IS1 family transposase
MRIIVLVGRWWPGYLESATIRQPKLYVKDLEHSGLVMILSQWMIGSDRRSESFKKAFRADVCRIGKEFTKGIEGNNCRLRHRIRRAFRRSCNRPAARFSKKLENHIIAFELAFFYINFGFV